MMRSGLFGFFLLMSMASSAWADGVSDANAGLQAMNQGDPKTAIRLFTQAIASGTLSNDDLEYAYAQRGNAYLQRNEPDHARRDADAALRLKPGDPDAVALWKSTTIQAAPPPKVSSQSPTAIVYHCLQMKNPNPNFHMTFNIDYDKHTIVSPEFGEQGRVLEANITDATISWSEQEEGANNGANISGNIDMVLNRSTGLLLDNFSWSTGAHGETQFQCHMGD
jgi:tetratricopeptide (TPR) repeat protein